MGKPDPKDDQNKTNNDQSTGTACSKCGGSGEFTVNGVRYTCDGPGPH